MAKQKGENGYQKDQKSGRLGANDRKFITAHVDSMLYTDIAKQLGRNPNTIRNYIKKELGKEVKKSPEPKIRPLTADLKSTLIWKDLERQFDSRELETFIFHWNRIISQFKEDVFATEELQIIDMIKLEILMNRCMEAEQEAREKIVEFKEEIAKEKLLENDANLDKISIFEEQIALNKAAYESIHGEYTDLLQRKASMLKELKGTREQRIKRLDDSKLSFMGWVTELLDSREMRRTLGMYLEKFRIAIDVEEARLQAPHRYLDDVYDLPILSAEALERLDNGNEKGQTIEE